MGFIVKKWLGGLLMPLPFLLLLMGLALLLVCCSRWQKKGKCLLIVSYLALVLLSLQPVADKLLAPLEQHYASYDPHSAANHHQPIDYIVVLGGGYTYNANWAISANLLNNSLARVTEGVALYYQLQQQQQQPIKLVFTGAANAENRYSNAQIAAKVAQSLGVPESAVIHLDTPKDTQQEAIACQKLMGNAPFLLVTSANHLPRAMRFFQQQGLSPIAAPANQLAISTPLASWDKYLPRPQYLSHSTRAWYETLGTLWQRLH